MDPLLSDSGYNEIADSYDLMMGNRDDYIQFYSSLITDSIDSLIDFGCGSGLVTAELAKLLATRSFRSPVHVTGLDATEGMIHQATARCASIQWILADLRRFTLSQKFDLGVSMYNTLQHLDADDILNALICIRRVLRDDAVFTFDIYNPNRTYLRVPQCNRLARLINREQLKPLQIREDTQFDEVRSLLSITWRLIDPDHQPNQPLHQTEFRLFQHDPEFIQSALAKAGFCVSEIYGDLDASPFSRSSRKQIYVCRAI